MIAAPCCYRTRQLLHRERPVHPREHAIEAIHRVPAVDREIESITLCLSDARMRDLKVERRAE